MTREIQIQWLGGTQPHAAYKRHSPATRQKEQGIRSQFVLGREVIRQPISSQRGTVDYE